MDVFITFINRLFFSHKKTIFKKILTLFLWNILKKK